MIFQMIKFQQKGYFHSIAEFHIFQNKVLGNGSFGVVTLATHIKTCKLYAIKILNLKKVEDQPELEVIENQIRIHMKLDHPHIVKLWDSILENNRLYMIMEFVEKGSLFHHQNKCARFTQLQAFKYFYQTLQALKYLHSRKIIHRDVKPQNLLLDGNMNIKLCDLGWATNYVTSKRNTFCGTYEYMAPQIVFQKQYDQKIDIWALGILLYEMLHGYAPFRGDLLSDVKNRMKVGAYNISSSVSKECKDLIISILKFEPEERVTLSEIEDHEWTIGIEKFMLSNFGENEYYNINSIHETKPNPNKLENYVNFNKDRKNSKNIHYRNHTQLSQHSSSPFLNVCDFANFDSSTEKLLPYKQLCTVSTKNTISSGKKGLFSSTYLFEGDEKPKQNTSKNHSKKSKHDKKSTPQMTLLLQAKNSMNEQQFLEEQYTKRKKQDTEFGEQRVKTINKRCKTITGPDMSYKKNNAVHSKKKKQNKIRNVTPNWKRKSQGNAIITGEFSIYVKDKMNSKSKSKSKSKERQKQKSKSKEKSNQKVYRLGKSSGNLKNLAKNSSQPTLTPFSKKKV